MEGGNTMQTYETLERLSRKMLVAARDAEWNLLVTLEQDSRRLVKALSTDDDGQELDEQHHQRRRQIIRQILADDAEIRDLAAPWMAQAKQFLTSLKAERQLLKSYRRDPSP